MATDQKDEDVSTEESENDEHIKFESINDFKEYYLKIKDKLD